MAGIIDIAGGIYFAAFLGLLSITGLDQCVRDSSKDKLINKHTLTGTVVDESFYRGGLLSRDEYLISLRLPGGDKTLVTFGYYDGSEEGAAKSLNTLLERGDAVEFNVAKNSELIIDDPQRYTGISGRLLENSK